jgi:hypothetical protein
MKDDIINNINNPAGLEKLYRKNKTAFKKEFEQVYLINKEVVSLQYWNERLNFQNDKIEVGSKNEILFIIIIAIIAGLMVNIPNLTGIDKESFFMRNISFIVFPLLSSYFLWKQKTKYKKWMLPFLMVIIAAVYINLLPNINTSNSITLAFIHVPFFLWSVLGYSFLGNNVNNSNRRIQYLRYNGDLVVISTIILLSTLLFSALTMQLFELIGIKIEQLYTQYILIWWLAAIPFLGTYLIQNNVQLINKVSPVIAKIFTPLVFLNLFIYLIAIIVTKKYPYQDRNLLLVFNALLIGVMALILFSVAEAGKGANHKISILVLFGLSVLTIIVNCIALSAISFRIIEWGVSPNRVGVLGGNILIFINLLMVSYRLFLSGFKNAEVEDVEKSIAQFLPIYGIWAGLVTFLFPLIFNFN